MTRVLTPAERVDVLLDENQKLRDELNAMDVAHQAQLAALGGAFEADRLEKDLSKDASIRGVQSQLADARVAHRAAEADNEELAGELELVRTTLAALWPGGDCDSAAALATATALALQGYRASEGGVRGWSADLVIIDEVVDFRPDYPSAPEIDMDSDLGPDRRSCAFTVWELLGVGIGAVVLGAASGAGAVVTLLGRWPW